MNFQEAKFFETEILVTKYLVLCGLEPLLNTHLESFVCATIKKDSGWVISIYMDVPEYLTSNFPFGIRVLGHKFVGSTVTDHARLHFHNLKDFKDWVGKGAIIAQEDGNVISGLIDLSDMDKEELKR